MHEVPLGHCVRCGDAIDASGPAVQAPHTARWEPFLEDVRSSTIEFLHVACFVESHGVDALVDAAPERPVGAVTRVAECGEEVLAPAPVPARP